MVDIFVGAQRFKFRMHEAILSDRSPFFKAAFEGRFKEGEEKTMDLPEDDPISFGLFAEWAYSRQHVPPHSTRRVMAFIRLYCMADRFCIESLKNAAIDQVREGYFIAKRPATGEELNYVWENTPVKSYLRTFMTEWTCHQFLSKQSFRADNEIFSEMMKDNAYVMEFLETVQVACKEWAKWNVRITSCKSCTYHQHEETAACK